MYLKLSKISLCVHLASRRLDKVKSRFSDKLGLDQLFWIVSIVVTQITRPTCLNDHIFLHRILVKGMLALDVLYAAEYRLILKPIFRTMKDRLRRYFPPTERENVRIEV